MSMQETLHGLFCSIETDDVYSEAVISLNDSSLLCFCHRVDERWAKAIGPVGTGSGCAEELLDAIQMFRLNAKHLQIFFNDGTTWEWIPRDGVTR